MVIKNAIRLALCTLLFVSGSGYAQEEDADKLITAVFNESPKELSQHLRSGIDVDATNRRGVTALMVAAMQGSESLVKMLLESDADPNLKDNDGMTALIHAMFNHNPRIAALLLQAGARVPTEEELDRIGASQQMRRDFARMRQAAEAAEEDWVLM